MIIETIAFVLMLALYFFSFKFLKINLFTEMLVGIIMGSAWEATTVGNWHYKGPILFVYGVPVGVVIGWGIMLMTASIISHFLKGAGLRKIAVNAFSTGIVGVAFEFLCAVVFDLWDYINYPETPLTFVKAFCSYAFGGILILNFVQTYGEDIERLFGLKRK